LARQQSPLRWRLKTATKRDLLKVATNWDLLFPPVRSSAWFASDMVLCSRRPVSLSQAAPLGTQLLLRRSASARATSRGSRRRPSRTAGWGSRRTSRRRIPTLTRGCRTSGRLLQQTAAAPIPGPAAILRTRTGTLPSPTRTVQQPPLQAKLKKQAGWPTLTDQLQQHSVNTTPALVNTALTQPSWLPGQRPGGGRAGAACRGGAERTVRTGRGQAEGVACQAQGQVNCGAEIKKGGAQPAGTAWSPNRKVNTR